MADDRLEKILVNWGAEYCGRFRDEPRRFRETASHPIARGMQFAPGKAVKHATRQVLGRGGVDRRRHMAANVRSLGVKSIAIVAASIVDPVPCRETRSRSGHIGRPVAPELVQVERAVQVLEEEVSFIRAFCVRAEYAGGESKQADRVAKVNEVLRQVSKGHEGISLKRYRDELKFARIWLHGRLLELLVAA